MFCRLETTKRTHTSIFALLCLLQGIVRMKFYCFARQVCREISQATTHYFFGLARLDPRLDSRLLRLDSRYSMHASFEDRVSKETVNLHLSGTVKQICRKVNLKSTNLLRIYKLWSATVFLNKFCSVVSKLMLIFINGMWHLSLCPSNVVCC